MENGKAATEQQPKACPKCGGTPRVLPGLYGGCYLACPGHHETKVTPTREEAVRLWNKGEYET